MREKPIIFSASMVNAILSGQKTQTRRVVNPQPSNGFDIDSPPVLGEITSSHPKSGRFGVFLRRGQGTEFPEVDIIACPYGRPGDQLWVREAWAVHRVWDDTMPSEIEAPMGVHYMADGEKPAMFGKVRPSIFMPRWASRIDLLITDVRVEHVQDISEKDIFCEGVDNGASNPWVWVIEFDRFNA